MKLSNWLEGEQLIVAENLGIPGLLLSLIPGKRAYELCALSWEIHMANRDIEFWEEAEADNPIRARYTSIEKSAEEFKVWRFTELYNTRKYFWLPRWSKKGE